MIFVVASIYVGDLYPAWDARWPEDPTAAFVVPGLQDIDLRPKRESGFRDVDPGSLGGEATLTIRAPLATGYKSGGPYSDADGDRQAFYLRMRGPHEIPGWAWFERTVVGYTDGLLPVHRFCEDAGEWEDQARREEPLAGYRVMYPVMYPTKWTVQAIQSGDATWGGGHWTIEQDPEGWTGFVARYKSDSEEKIWGLAADPE